MFEQALIEYLRTGLAFVSEFVLGGGGGSCGQGGRSTYRTCEVYNPVRDTWRPMQAQLRVERKYVGVCALDNRIFAVGGMNEQRARLRSVETYDPREGRSDGCASGDRLVFGGFEL